MQRALAALTIVLMLGMVLARVVILRRQGVRAVKFAKQDKTDFLIPPFALFYFYLVFANALWLADPPPADALLCAQFLVFPS